MPVILISTLVLAASFGCVNLETSTREAELRSAIAAYRTALNSGDSAAFFGLLAPDLEVLAPGAHPVRGPEAREFFRPLFTQVKPDIGPFTNEEVTLSGDIAIQRHSYQLSTSPRSGGPVTTVIGSGLHIWKRCLTADGRSSRTSGLARPRRNRFLEVVLLRTASLTSARLAVHGRRRGSPCR